MSISEFAQQKLASVMCSQTAAQSITDAVETLEAGGATEVLSVYADATARDAAIASPVAGQTIYNTELGITQTYVSAAWAWDDPDDTIAFTQRVNIGDDPATNSVDPMVNVNRNVDDTTAGSGHCFSDSSVVDRSGTIAYNSFDARIEYSGSNNYDHFTAFQNGVDLGSSGQMTNMYGFIDVPTISDGTLINRYGIKINDITESGSGSVTNNYGLHIEDLTAGSSKNYCLYIDAVNTKSLINSPLHIHAPTSLQANAIAGGIVFSLDEAGHNLKVNVLYSNGSTQKVATIPLV